MSLFKNYPSYPNTLWYKDWQKHQGILVKIFKKDTAADLSAKMKTAEQEYNKIKAWLFAGSSVDYSTKASCDKALKAATEEFNGQIKQFIEKLKAVKLAADAAETKIKDQKLVPNATRARFKEVSKAAQKFMDDYRQFVLDAMKDIKDEKAKATS
jgi:hypothetical protein